MDLSQEVTAAKGIGEKTAKKLQKAGIFTLRDLLYLLPRGYENFQNSVKIADLHPGKVMVRGKISHIETKNTRRRNFTVTTATVSDDSGTVRIVWFNQAYRAKQFDEKREYYFTGNYELKNGRYQIISPSAVLAQDAEVGSSNLNPIYPSRNGITSIKFCQFFEGLKSQFFGIPDLLPNLEDAPIEPGLRADALYKIHFPDTTEEIETARKYLAYEELYELILAAQLMKTESKKLKSDSMPFVLENTKKLLKNLPFTLTAAQKRATWDILQDLEKETPMNRLLQGDVGSGKTVVAAISAFQAISSGFQVALLAPTSILAEQHAEGLDELLAPLGVRTALLVGATKHKDLVKKQIREGNVDLIIGTHALITDDTNFHHLGLCIIDEQHRFGVNQRQKLLTKTEHNVVKPADGKPRAPHLLTMTATPIPRSLQLTAFGDLDVSIINQLPKGRQPIKTKIIKEIAQRAELYPKIISEIEAGHQVYWICRAIDDPSSTSAASGATSETISVKKQTKKLQNLFPKLKIEFLHGKMKAAEKDEIMAKFANKKIDILVSTTVVEVGVNVPNATLMVISDAENYGLAQLHQLRGRVGRGSAESFCYLISNSDTPSRRLQAMEKSTDGFYLAEMDLKIRGPGEIYGSLQHGALDLHIASLTDTKTIAKASKAAKTAARYFSQNPENMLKYKELFSGISHYQQLTILN